MSRFVKLKFSRVLWALLLTGLITSCSTTKTPPGLQPIDKVALLKKAEKLSSENKLAESAHTFLRLATISSPADRIEHHLKAAALLLKGNYIDEAKRSINEIKQNHTKGLQRLRYNIIKSKIALAEKKPAIASELLSNPLPKNTSDLLRKEVHQLRARSFAWLGNTLESIKERIHLDRLPTSSKLKKENQQTIWHTLSILSTEMLGRLRVAPPPDELSGWLELSYITRLFQQQPVKRDKQLRSWKQRYPEHPATQEILSSLLESQHQPLQKVNTIALLLPLSGPFAIAGTAVRDGFITAYYQDKSSEKPALKIYDVSGDINQMPYTYEQAINDGAEFVVGPLKKEAVSQIAGLARLPVPILALNYDKNTGDLFKNNLYKIGLTPEDEAQQIAEYAWLNGHNQAIAIAPEGNWGKRVLTAFSQHWESLGGTVTESIQYPPHKNDFAGPLKQVLNLNESEQRKKRIQKLIKKDLKFKPRRRQDIDFIFMAAFPRQARLIRPQLKFHYAGDLPIYSTSHVFSGQANPDLDRDIDGVEFSDMPWLLSKKYRSQKAKTRQLWHEAADKLPRLFALGIDAHNLISQLGRLKNYGYESFSGVTGTLYLNSTNTIHRELSWAKFKRGKPTLFTVNSRL